MFDRSVNNRWNSLNKNVNIHTFRELEKYQDETTESYIKNARQEAIINYQDPESVAISIDRQENAILSFAKDNGKSAEWIKEKRIDARSKTHSGVISRMLSNGQDLAARDYFQEVRGTMSVSDIKQMEGAVREGSIRGESQRQAEIIMAKEGSTLSEQLEEARRISDADVQSATVREIKTRSQENKLADQQLAEQRFQEAANVVEQTSGRPDPTGS